MIWRCFKLSHPQNKTKESNALMTQIHELLLKQTGVSNARFVHYTKSIRRGLVAGRQEIANGVSEDEATGGHVCFLPEIRFEMDNFCGSNAVLRKLHLLSNHCIYHQDTSIYPIRIGADHAEYHLRKRTFDGLKMAHQHLIRMWKDTLTKAPFKCECLKPDGFHEGLTPFMTMISHRDDLLENWTLDRRSVVFATKDDDPMEHIENFEPVFIHSDGQFKSVFVETVEELDKLINTQSFDWFNFRADVFSRQLDMFAEAERVNADPVGNDVALRKFDPQRFDAEIEEGEHSVKREP
ncbi:hypothetical protein GCK72_026244 [Caenorhabditis remanei]|uniref:Uncharacterized protein n=1 Tax=Caenorhabditis remanei TaxID=31234 RepID=A0A6A5G4Y0_CAERE|nr:hypothetical protein GCK72_026244 [Caenorhabditis remanei]KAF1749775.1 hypothetical protein GCK72_026244 [Caenorhabditis remanei]